MARRRRRGGGRRRGRGGFSFSPLNIALIGALVLSLIFVIKTFASDNPKPVRVYSEHDVFIIDSSSHTEAENLTRAKIFKRMSNPFGSYVVEGKEVSENGSGLAAEISVVVISSQTNLSMRQDIVSHDKIDEIWSSLLKDSNYSRSADIYKSFMAPSSPIWKEVVKQYFVDNDGLSNVSTCSSELSRIANNLAADGGNFSRALGYLDRAADGGKDGAWNILCQFAHDMKSNYQEIGRVLDLASAVCRDVKQTINRKCSDIPGATEQIQSIVQERENWVSTQEKGIKKFALVCAYFGSDMITNSEDDSSEFLDLHTLLKTKKFQKVEGGPGNLGSKGASLVLGNTFTSNVKVNIYAPNIGDTQDLNAKVGGMEGINFVKEYWSAYFAQGFNATMSDANYGCEGKEFEYQGGN